MKEGQYFEITNDSATNYLERNLHDIAQGGYAIRAILCCKNAVRMRHMQQENDEFSLLDEVDPNALEDAISLLGKFIYEKSNDLCERFGIVDGV